MELLDRIKKLFELHFPSATVELETAQSGRRISGFLIWDGFEDSDPLERQQQLWNLLRKELLREEQFQISAILTVTPNEIFVMREG